MRILCVAEKPSIAKSIANILSRGHPSNRPGKDKFCRNYDFQYKMPGVQGMVDMTMTSVRGHLTNADFGPEYKAWHSCSPADLFQAPITTNLSDDAKSIGTNLRMEARNADAVMIWTDCDREGEHIGSEIVTEIRKVKRNIRVMRARFSAIIDSQIHAACQNTVDLDWRAADAVESRIQLDLRIGAAFSRMQTLALQNRIPALNEARQVISYGPCQFPTLGFVVDRYTKVTQFVPEPFWLLQVHKTRSMHGGDPSPNDTPDEICKVVFNWDRVHLFDKKAVQIFRDLCRADPDATVETVTNKQTKKWKPYPLTTVELQKSGSRLLRLTPKRILDIAESLYQKGFLSYPRTETDQYDKDFDFNSLIAKQTADGSWGNIAQRLLDGTFERPRNGRNNDKAHPPIHPTSHANGLSGDDKRVYDYVTRRFLASCWSDAIGNQTTVAVSIAGERFHASGLVILQRNYLEVFIYDKWEGTLLPPFTQGEVFRPTKFEMKQGSTSPPKLLTEADLVNLMDKNGIGTDATIAEHIAKVIERRYVMSVKEGKTTYLVPSTLGIGLVEGYNQLNLEKSLSKPLLRRETEYRMSLICAGQRSKAETIAESIEEYREVFALTNRQFDRIARTVLQYLTDPNAGQEARAVELFEGDDGMENDDDDGFDSDGDDDIDGGGGGGGRAAPRGRGRGRGRAVASTRGARGGRGGAAPATAAATRIPPRPPPTFDGQNDDDIAIQPPSRIDATRTAASAAPIHSRPTSDHGNDSKTCQCGDPAVERTVNKEGPNQGRRFYTCAKPMGDPGKCNFFDWADNTTVANLNNSSRTVAAKRPASYIDRDTDEGRGSGGGGNGGWSSNMRTNTFTSANGARRCECNLEAERRSVTKAGPNQGKFFYTCGRESARLRCKYFEWSDEAPAIHNGSHTVSEGGGGGGGSGSGIGSCYRCGQPGHWASDCPNPPQQQQRYNNSSGRNTNDRSSIESRGAKRKRGSSRGGGKGGSKTGGKDDGCFRCGKKGHWSSECPNG
ncbi:related to DNA topoisomerase III alpha [Melanopsichium pennsylvanicum]|uniref:DNA topoisomerase n=2 Tax=Melanopsichium pennsylvanicum TaxID=63383 RepID=A0AAJ5C587_9BASI|nr:related to DNA topoisomerase III alpha [Melanopsichium pennsylvanicum 4]SNX84481.1 related to DNA topoisomerase III alpha [Melanopsichium pennsylvanicum]